MSMATVEYLETKVMTATPHQLHLMVIDGAIRHTATAQNALERQDFDKAHAALCEARKFVSEVVVGLDSKRLPDVVDKLKALFVFIHRNLVEADLRKNLDHVRDALSILRMHRETWLAVGEQLKRESATAPATRERGTFSWSS